MVEIGNMFLGLKLTSLLLNQIRVSLESDSSSEENRLYDHKLKTQLDLVQICVKCMIAILQIKWLMYCRKLVDQEWILRTFLIRFIIQNEAVMFSMHPYEEIRFKTRLNSFRHSFVKKRAYKPVLKTLGILSSIACVAPGK